MQVALGHWHLWTEIDISGFNVEEQNYVCSWLRKRGSNCALNASKLVVIDSWSLSLDSIKKTWRTVARNGEIFWETPQEVIEISRETAQEMSEARNHRLTFIIRLISLRPWPSVWYECMEMAVVILIYMDDNHPGDPGVIWYSGLL